MKYNYAPLVSRAALQTGFTLIETLAALSIVGIVITVAIPQFNSHTTGLALRHEASALQTFLELSAAYALTARTTVEIRANSEGLGKSITATQSDGTLISTHRVQHGASLDLATSSTFPLSLYPSISASPATLILNKNSRSCSVIISLRGRVRTTC